MRILAIGDVHGKWNRVQKIVEQEAERVILSVGDLCNYNYAANGIKFIFVHGNHEAFEYVRQLHENPNGYRPLFAGDVYRVEDIGIAGLPGVYSPRFFDKKERPLKYFGLEDVERVESLEGIDILLTHEAPSNIGLEKHGKQIGRPEIRRVIERLQPRIAFFGHHHRAFESQIGRTRVIGLDQPHKSYILLNTSNMNVERNMARLRNGVFRYEWE